MPEYYWIDAETILSHSYKCGHCGREIASQKGYSAYEVIVRGRRENAAFIYICHHCKMPTFIATRQQIPMPLLGREVAHVPLSVKQLYNEARRCLQANAPTGSALCSRKLLMNIAVQKEAEENKKFAYYVQFLAEKGYVPPGGESWVDHIRQKGNEAAHEIPDIKMEDATELINFVEMLLAFIYEFPGRVPKKEKPGAGS
jgi:hypothetical protein